MAKDSKKKVQPKASAKATKATPKRKAILPLPGDLTQAAAAMAKPRKAVRKAESRHLLPLDIPTDGKPEVLDRLWETIESRRLSGDTTNSHSARLLARGTPKVAQKLGEEAVECVIEATLGNRKATVSESADLLYHLLVVWVDAGIRPDEVWQELERRQGISGIAEKASRPKGIIRAANTTKLP